MDGITTTDESLVATRRAIDRWFDEAVGLATQCNAKVSAVEQAVQDRLRQNRRRAADLQSQLSSASDEEHAADLRRELARVEANAESIRAAARSAEEAKEATRSIGRWLRASVSSRVASASNDLQAKAGALDKYRASQMGGSDLATGAAGMAGGGASTSADSETVGYPGQTEIVDVNLSDVDFSDNPIEGEFGRGGAAESDYRWAVETWETVVRPGVKRGMTRDDFARRDEARGASGFRQSARVYEIFMGSDRIRLSSNGNGTYNVTNGRHRIAVARSLGIQKLPGVIR